MGPPVDDRLSDVARFDFRSVHPHIRFGTASDRYAGWIGQIYSEDWRDRVSTRRRQLGGKSYKEATVPTEAVGEYFQHFSVLELDFTFYRPLIESDGAPSTNYHVVERYRDHAPEEARFLVKAPQAVCTPFLPGVGRNDDFLNPDLYVRQFSAPLVELLGERLCGVIFEQGYQSVRQTPPAEAFVEEFDRFFDQIGAQPQVHLEIRSPHLLTPSYFDWLETRGLGHVYSHWSWLPSIKRQWEVSGRFTAADSTTVLRLLTPRKMSYADAYGLAHPFDRVVPELAEAWSARSMIDESVALIYKAIESGVTVEMISNNRAWGNAPELAAEVARRFLEFERKR